LCADAEGGNQCRHRYRQEKRTTTQCRELESRAHISIVVAWNLRLEHFSCVAAGRPLAYSEDMRPRLALPGLLLVALLTTFGCGGSSRITISEVENQVRNLLQLHTYEHVYRDVVYFGEERSFWFIQTVDRQLLFSVNIVVRAGLDLTDGVTITRDAENPSRVYVALPEARILLIDADEQSIEQFLVREQGGRIGVLEFSEQLEAVKGRIEEDAIERGILMKARANAERMVRNFLQLAGFEEVVFATRQRDQEIEG
jgi:hypothetical protein